MPRPNTIFIVFRQPLLRAPYSGASKIRTNPQHTHFSEPIPNLSVSAARTRPNASMIMTNPAGHDPTAVNPIPGQVFRLHQILVLFSTYQWK